MLYWRSGNCSVKALIVSNISKCQQCSTEHNAALKLRGKAAVQKIDCIDTKVVSLIRNAESVFCPNWTYSCYASEYSSAEEMMTRSRKRFAFKERSAETVQPKPKKPQSSVTQHWLTTNFRNKGLIHTHFYVLPPKRAEWLGNNMQP